MKSYVGVVVIGLCLPLVASGAIVSQTYTMTVVSPIPDGLSGGGGGAPLLSTINVPLGYNVAGVEVYIDVSMQDWSSDLIIGLMSPLGTSARLFFIGEGGEPATNPAGWYPTDFTPKDDISIWIGEPSAGAWVLDCRDFSHEAIGTLNEWRLKIIYDDTLAGDGETWSGVKALYR